MMRRTCMLLALAGVLCFVTSSASGNYVLSLESDAATDSAVVLPGESFDLSVYLRYADPGTGHNILSAAFDLVFSEGGIVYDAYSWESPFGTGDDDSTVPGITIVDSIRLDDADVGGGSFSQGLLATLTMTVPSAWAGSTLVTITPVPVASYFQDADAEPNAIPTVGGGDFTVLTTPEPSTTYLALLSLVFGGRFAARKRKQDKKQS